MHNLMEFKMPLAKQNDMKAPSHIQGTLILKSCEISIAILISV